MENGRLDSTRLVFSAREMGLTGYALKQILYEKYAVNLELADQENVLAIVTYANELQDLDRLIAACAEISRTHVGYSRLQKNVYPHFPMFPEQVMTPRDAYFSKKISVHWQEAVGLVSGQMIAPYPPGIPVIYPGERINQEVWAYIDCFHREKCHIHGMDRDGKLGKVQIIPE